jgi:hypothetical protein
MMISKKLTITAGLFGAMALCIAASLPQQPQQGPPPGFQNLKVLPKNLTHQQLGHIMEQWAGSLGVHCTFCHVRDEAAKKMDFASDAKPEKTTARHMFQMMNKINKKYFEAKKDSLGMMMESGVACVTCHHGSPHPEIKVPEREHGPGGPPPGTPPPGGAVAPPSGR